RFAVCVLEGGDNELVGDRLRVGEVGGERREQRLALKQFTLPAGWHRFELPASAACAELERLLELVSKIRKRQPDRILTRLLEAADHTSIGDVFSAADVEGELGQHRVAREPGLGFDGGDLLLALCLLPGGVDAERRGGGSAA